MNLRSLVVILLLANLLLWAWTQGALQKWGWVPSQASQSRPVPQEVRPETLDIRPLDDVLARVDASKPRAEASPDPDWPLGAAVAPLPPADRADDTVDTQPLPAAAGDDDLPASDGTAAGDGHGGDEARPDGVQAPEGGALETADADEPATVAADAEAGSAGEGAATPGVCWQAGPFNQAQARALRRAAASLPPGSWQLLESPGRAPRWMVYMGGMIDELEVLAKRNELHAAGVDVDRPGVGFEPGLSLGRYSSEAAAERALQALQGTPGVAGARVVQERAEETTYFLRAESAQTGWRAHLQQLPLAGRSLRHCS